MKQEPDNTWQEDQSSLLQLSGYSIEGQLKEGTIQGSFSFWCEEEKPIKGKVIVTDPRFTCTPETFQGNNIEISYVFQSSFVGERESISGSFLLITNYGEYEITYCFTEEDEKLVSSMGEIKNLFHFTNLAKANWEEGLKLYYSPAFIKMLENTSPEYVTLYQGLSTRQKAQYMEEFLQVINKKRPVSYQVHETMIYLNNIHTGYKEELHLQREGWGYTRLEVSCEGGFLSLEKRVIREEDFMGNAYRLGIFIDPAKLHQGRNWGAIFLKSPYETIRIPVQVHQNEYHRIRQAAEKRRNAKWLNSKLTGMYLNFRSKKVGSGRFKKEAEEILEALTKSDDRNPLTRLYGAHLYITQEKYHEAKWLLDRAGKLIQEENSPVMYAYYLYLSTLITEDEDYLIRVREKIEGLHYTYDTVWQISWLYMYLAKPLRQNPQKKWDFLKEIFHRGCTSPVMYLEAALLLNYQPTLLMELSEIEIRILRFAAGRDLLSEEVKGVIGYLASREKEYRKNVCDLLEVLCTREERTDFLQAYCSILIRGGKTGERYVKWYEKAILCELKLTRLYESYMLSLNLNKEIDLPRMVLMYFSYQQDIREEYGAYIYRYVYENREALEDLYITYVPKIERYLLRKLHGGKIDRDLGYLYQHVLYPKMITEDNARALAKIIFCHRIPEEKIRGKRLIVVHKQLKEEESYEAVHGLKQVRIYNQSYVLFWEDESGNRYTYREEELPEAYLKVRRMAEEVAKWVADEPALALAFCEENNDWQTMNWKTEAQFKFLLGQDFIREEIKKNLAAALLDFYYENEAMERLDYFLEAITPSFLARKDRNRLIRYMVLRDYHPQAYELIKEYGTEEIEPKMLVRISSYMLEEDSGEEEILCWYIHTAFKKGKYNTAMLEYLVENFQGSSKQLRDIFYAALDFQVDTYYLSERLLMQILFTKAYIGDEVAIFKDYISGGAKTNIEAAFLTYRSIGYMRDDRIMEEELVKSIERVHKRGYGMPLVTRLAYLRYYAENKELLSRLSEGVIKEFLEEAVLEKGLNLPFLQEYSFVEGMEFLSDKTLLSYKTKAKTKVVIHYRKIGSGEEEAFKREELKEIYYGTYSKEFVLFYGEEIQYYITEVLEQKEQLTESGSLKKEENKEGRKESRYQRINEMAIATSLSDYHSLEQMLEEYWRKEYIAKQVFYL
ncbi:MAG: hypothetical protein IKW28_03185 [Lachnospiraceae bacterium]|nr:hypothetical protein [Lachnospiraceae bacterium]